MSSKKIFDLMEESKLFSGFNAEDCMLIEKIMKPYDKLFLKGEVVYDEDEEIKCIGQIIYGKVIGEKFNLDGKAHLVHAFDKMEIIGLETIYSIKKESPITYTAAEDTHMLMIPYSPTDHQADISLELQIKMKDNMLRVLADGNIKNLYKLEVLSKRALRCRIRTFLSIMEKKVGSNTFHIGMDREQFAEYLCVNRSALSYELGQMKKDGMITFDRDLFTII